MTTRAFTTVVVRILALAALYKGAATGLSGLSALMMLLPKSGFQGMGGVSSLSLASPALVAGCALPIIVGVNCLVFTRALVDFLTKETEEESERAPSS